MRRKIVTVVAAVVVIVAIVGAVGYVLMTEDKKTQTLMLATTTSTYDSGLLDYILPVFEDEHNCKVDVIAVGSGAAMELGKNGDVDVLLVHSPVAEATFLADGYGEARILVMYNNFVVVGSVSDPAGTNNSANVTVAFEKIYDNGTAGEAQFLSRGDNSGTYNKEIAIWKTLGLNASTFGDWYISTGLGMGDLLDMCEEEDATTPSYTLSDDATYYQRVSQNTIPHLGIVYNWQTTDSLLKNQYSVIVLNETRYPATNHTLATEFKDWVISQSGQDLIAGYEKYGHQLFFPNAAGYTPSTTSLPNFVSLMGRTDAVQSAAPDLRTEAQIWCARW